MLALIALFLLQVPPVAGRPADFSGAVGGPFVAAARVDRPSVAVGDPVELTLTVTGPGDLSGLRRPDLKRLSDFASRFDVRDGLESHSPHPPSRRFTYWLRPRSADVSAVPRVKLVYYNPAVRAFQTTYSEPVPLRVAPREPARPAVPAEVTRWADRVDALAAPTLARVGWSRLDGIVPWLIPPAACLFGYAAWRFVRGRPTDAAAERALQRLRAPADDPARTVADTLCEFLRDRVGLPAGATSPADVSAFLYDHRLPPAAIDRVRSVLARCDEWRYADGRAQAQPLSPAELIADAASLIRRWEWPR